MNNEYVKISVIVPVYKVPEIYLRKCIESLVEQNLKEIEIILVDDETPDDGGKICDEYAKKYNNIKVIHQKNQGVSVARNSGIEIARGEWVAFVDSDDWVEEDMFSKLYNVAKKSDSEIIICSTYVNYEEKQVENSFFKYETKKFEGKEKEEVQLQLIAKGVNNYFPPEVGCGVPWGKLYKKEFIEKKKLRFIPNLVRMQDNIFNLYAFEEANSILYVNEFLYHYRKSNESVCNKYNEKVIEYFEKVNKQTEIFINKYNKSEIFKKALDIKIVMSFHSYFLLNFFNKQNNKKYIVKRKEIIELINSEPYSTSIKNIDFSLLIPLEKIFVKCISKKWIFALYLLMNIKEKMYSITNRKKCK